MLAFYTKRSNIIPVSNRKQKSKQETRILKVGELV